MNQSPLRYPGGKTRACKLLFEIVNNHFSLENTEAVVSPFFGGGSFEFFLQNKYPHLEIYANDKFSPLITFWSYLKEDKDSLCDLLNHHLKNKLMKKELFLHLRQKVMDLQGLEQASAFFLINRCSFSGATLSGGFSQEASEKRFTASCIAKCKNINLQNVFFSNKDFEDFLENVTTQNKKTFLFLDPPYYLENKSKLYGNNGDLHEDFDHQRFYNCISSKTNWCLTYNDCPFIRNLYKNFKIIEVNWSYGMNKTKKSSEIVIIG